MIEKQRRQKTERIDIRGVRIHNESNKLPGHADRMEALCERIKEEQKKNEKRKKK